MPLADWVGYLNFAKVYHFYNKYFFFYKFAKVYFFTRVGFAKKLMNPLKYQVGIFPKKSRESIYCMFH